VTGVKKWERGPRSDELAAVGDIVTGLLGERALAQGVILGRLAQRWQEVVGARLANETAPGRFEGGFLTVWASSGPWGTQVTFLADEVCKRANMALGQEAVRGVRVVVRPEGQDGSKPL